MIKIFIKFVIDQVDEQYKQTRKKIFDCCFMLNHLSLNVLNFELAINENIKTIGQMTTRIQYLN